MARVVVVIPYASDPVNNPSVYWIVILLWVNEVWIPHHISANHVILSPKVLRTQLIRSAMASRWLHSALSLLFRTCVRNSDGIRYEW